MADNNSFEQWELEGARDSVERANAVWKSALNEYSPPPLDEAKEAELVDWIARRKAEFPDSDV